MCFVFEKQIHLNKFCFVLGRVNQSVVNEPFHPQYARPPTELFQILQNNYIMALESTFLIFILLGLPRFAILKICLERLKKTTLFFKRKGENFVLIPKMFWSKKKIFDLTNKQTLDNLMLRYPKFSYF